MNFFKNAKLQLWYALNDSPVFKTNVRRWLRILKLEQSFYYPDCIKFYSGLDFAGKGVLDIGSDFGTSPMYFLGNCATFVVGISLDSQYFHDHRYTHYQVKKEELKMETLRHVQDKFKCKVLKSDCEGFEWELTPEFISGFEDWVIALHTPISNEPLHEWIKENGEQIGENRNREFTGRCCEFAVYRKVKL